MNRTKGLAWGMLATLIVFLIAVIVFIASLINAIENDYDFMSFGFFGVSVFAGVLMIISMISCIVLGILMIVFAVKDHSGGIYIATGIVSICFAVFCFVPILYLFLWIALLVLVIISLAKRF